MTMIDSTMEVELEALLGDAPEDSNTSITGRRENIYLFEGANPINRLDPMGLQATQPATTQANDNGVKIMEVPDPNFFERTKEGGALAGTAVKDGLIVVVYSTKPTCSLMTFYSRLNLVTGMPTAKAYVEASQRVPITIEEAQRQIDQAVGFERTMWQSGVSAAWNKGISALKLDLAKLQIPGEPDYQAAVKAAIAKTGVAIGADWQVLENDDFNRRKNLPGASPQRPTYGVDVWKKIDVFVLSEEQFKQFEPMIKDLLGPTTQPTTIPATTQGR